MSFENPGAPASLLQPQPPELQLSIDVNAGGLAPGSYEVVLAIRAAARSAKGDILFMLELAYAAAVTLTNVAEGDMAEALLVETPRLHLPLRPRAGGRDNARRRLPADAAADRRFQGIIAPPPGRRGQAAAAAPNPNPSRAEI